MRDELHDKLHDDFEADVWDRSVATGLETYTAAIQLLLERVAELEEQVAKLKRRRCGCCNSEVCEYE